ncbi:helix-turn-helix transcriptional regulator [Cellulomonas gilvus]|uniref:Putative transcriptional regulator n=1 Tax=Cellulomonas gilvus (strain ATCC 13127 / NRRL B-14078) TaxID=593907 RepID=F8A7M4_CELGA|nr:helix-turn-helix domain-containing protein [Cellulomonas gilvus]AEI12426.1 putative transcriptional regulator [Cellulomonas gilvus ATCC 13127]
MSGMLPVTPLAPDATADSSHDAGTRQRVLQIVAGQGPISAADLATRLDLTPAAIRRHLGVLESTDQIAVHDGAEVGPVRRGRPARRYVVTTNGQSALSHRYAEIAAQALRYLADTAGADAVAGFAEQRVAELEQRLAARLRDVAEDDVAARTEALARALSEDGYAASARPVPGTHAVQLCQGHCPVQDVAHEFPQLCDAEARAFSRLLGVHVQRLATLARGGHVCTTNIPVARTRGHRTPTTTNPPVLAPEGTIA